MNVTAVRHTRNGAIELTVNRDVFRVTQAERTRGDVTDTPTLRTRLEASLGKALPVDAHLYVAPSGNEYIIIGQLPKPNRMPEMNPGGRPPRA